MKTYRLDHPTPGMTLIPGLPGYGAELIALAGKSTPPVENSNPEGGPKGTDGRGVCTIHTAALGDVWLPSYSQELREFDLARRLYESAHRRGLKDTLSYTGLFWHAERALEVTVEHIRKRGGLLLIGGVQ